MSEKRDDKQKILDYYQDCHVDYKYVWKTEKNLSFHYGFYDKKHRKHNEAVINMNRVLADILKIKEGDKILDAGCGIGGSSIWLAKNFKAKVTGINISEKHLEIAKQLVQKNSLEPLVNFECQDYNKTNFQDNYFDFIWAIESVCHSNNRKNFLIEAKRILKPNGKIIIADFFKSNNFQSDKKKKILSKWLNGWAMQELSTIEEFLLYFKELSFKNIMFIDITKNVEPSSKRLFIFSIISLFLYPVGLILKWFRIRTKIQNSNERSAYYQYKALKNKSWVYAIFCAEK